jgi:hypothetical protein
VMNLSGGEGGSEGDPADGCASESCCPQYRLAPVPRARYDFACAGLVFICILLVHALVMPRSV